MIKLEKWQKISEDQIIILREWKMNDCRIEHSLDRSIGFDH